MRIPLASLANTGALSRKEGMIKSVEQEKESIRKILQAGLKNGYISQAEMDEALYLRTISVNIVRHFNEKQGFFNDLKFII